MCIAAQESNQDLDKEDQIPIIGYQIPYAKHNTPQHCNPLICPGKKILIINVNHLVHPSPEKTRCFINYAVIQNYY